MKLSGTSRYITLTALVMTLPATTMAACGAERSDGFAQPEPSFQPDGSVDAPECGLQCSLDGRAVTESCSGTVVETCPEHLACGGAKCLEPCAAAAADRSSNGCDFYFQSPQFEKGVPPSCHAAFIVNTSNQPVELSLELAGTSLDVSNALFRTTPGDATLIPHAGPIPPGESVILFLADASPSMPRGSGSLWRSYKACPRDVTPATLATTLTGGTGKGSSYRLRANAPIALTSIFPFGGATSYIPTAMLVFPVASWAKEHIVIDGWERAWSGRPGLQIVASEDDTEVTLVSRVDVQDGVDVKGGRAGQHLKYVLGKGEYLRFVQDQQLIGSVVATSKPTTIFGGQGCGNIPANAPACDILGQQIPAFERWGSEYVGVGYRPRLGNEHEPVLYRIVAARDATMLDYDPEIPGGAPTTLNAGETATFRQGTSDAFVVRTQDSEHPIYVAAHMTGCGGDRITDTPSYADHGDPEFVNVVAAGQYLNSYSFYADPTYRDTSLVVVRAKLRDDFKDVWLECAGNLTEWKPVGTRGKYEYTRIDLARAGLPGDTFEGRVCRNGLQRMKSEGPFTATLWGWDHSASYAYPGGMAQRKLVDGVLDIR